MDHRQAYERNVLSSFARLAERRTPGIADADRDGEFRAQQIFYNALSRFRARVAEAAPLTGLRQAALNDLLDTLDDTTPDRSAWDEAIHDARRYG